MGLVAHYKLDGNAEDAFGKYNGTASNVTWVDGKLGQAGSFNGSNSHIPLPRNQYTMPVGSFSLSFWVNPSSVSATGRRTLFLSGRDTNSGVEIYRSGISTSFVFRVFINGTARACSFSVPNSVWSQVCCTFDSNYGLRVYVNGIHVSTQLFAGAVTYTQMYGTSPSIGSHGGIYFFNGLIDDVRIYDHALSEREVRDLAQGKVLSVSLRSDLISDKTLLHNIVPVGSSAFLPEDIAWSVQGSGNYINTTYAPYFDSISNEFTIATWFKHSSSTGAKRIFGARDSSKSGNPLIELFGGYTRVQALIRGNNGVRRDIVQDVSLDPAQFHHLVWVCSNGNSFLYLNGNLVGQNTSGYDPLINLKDVSLPIGGTRLENSVQSNEIDIVRSLDVFHTALSADEVKEIYQQRASLDSRGNLLC